MSLNTTSAVLGDSPVAKNKMTISATGGFTSTDGFKPDVVEVDGSDNPRPVTGYVQLFASDVARVRNAVCSPPVGSNRLFIDEPEAVLGPDDRVRVANTSVWPFAVQGHLVMKFPNGKAYIGSGTMVSKHHVLTAGHCIFSKADGGWATSVQFRAAQDDESLPFGSISASRLLSVQEWTEGTNSAFDMGMLILQSDLGEKTGWFGVITTQTDNDLIKKRVNVTGYPGDKGGQQMWTHADAIKSLTDETAQYDIDTFGGQSGSGVWSTFAGHTGEKVACIHTTGASTGNGSTRISKTKFDRIVAWMQEF